MGRTVREDVVSGSAFPACDLSAMDGYSVAASDVAGASGANPVRLRMVGTVRAGEAPRGRIERGECYEIMTGAALPEGADTVVPQEAVKVEDGSISIGAPCTAGDFVRRRGGVLAAGEKIALEGRRASPQVLALLDAIGVSEVSVTKRPRVAVIATGDELASGEAPPDRFHIRPSNLTMLAALVSAAGCVVGEARRSRDSERQLAERFDACARCDAVVVSGGVAGGKFDLVKSALGRAGAAIRFEDVLMSPGKRTVFATKGDTSFFCLPGNPFAALVSFQAIALPGISTLLGLKDPLPRTFCMRLAASIDAGRTEDGWTRFVPGRITGSMEVEPIKMRATGDIVSLAETTCLIRLDPDQSTASTGDLVSIWTVPEGVAS